MNLIWLDNLKKQKDAYRIARRLGNEDVGRWTKELGLSKRKKSKYSVTYCKVKISKAKANLRILEKGLGWVTWAKKNNR